MTFEEVNHEYTDEMVCPYCGHKHTDLWDWEGAYKEDELRVDCEECGHEFASFCQISYSFVTRKVDKKAEEAKRRQLVEAEKARWEARRVEAIKFLPGTRVRVCMKPGTPFSSWYCGQEGVVANEELDRRGFVQVDLDGQEGLHPCLFDAQFLERIDDE